MNSILARKLEQGQKFLENGNRIPVTKLAVGGNVVVALKSQASDKYSAVQLGFEKRVKALPKGSSKSPFRFLREVRMADTDTLPTVGDVIKASDIFKPGDIVNVTGISKGKGYAGGVKRHNFRGGPRTHGQSDRERAPGSIGSTTTPGRVYKGQRMAGRMGQDKVTVQNIKIMAVSDDFILVKGLVPGARNTLLTLKKVKDVNSKFVPLYADKVEAASAEGSVEQKEVKAEAPAEVKAEAPVEAKAEAKVEEVKKEEKPAETKVEVKAAAVAQSSGELKEVKEETK